MASYIENKQKFIAVGDMNLNLLNDSTLNKKYIDAIITNGAAFLNKISSTYATRIATRNHGDRVTTSNSIIDHIFTDCIRFAYKLSYCDTTLSDHRELLLSIDNHKTADFIATDKLCRGQKMDMVEYNFDLHCFLSDTQINTFDELIDGMKCCKESNVHSYTYTFKVNPHKPWISNDLILLIQERKRYFLLLKKSPTNEYLKTKYDKLCSDIKNMRTRCKLDYNSRTLNKNINNPKQMWKDVNQIVYNRVSEKKSVSILETRNGDLTMDRTVISRTLNEYFKNVGRELHDNVPSIVAQPIFRNELHIPNTMFLFETNPNEIYLKIMCMKNNKTCR